MGIAELACVLSSAVEAVESDAQSVTKLLLQLCSLLESPEAATELDEILLDLHVTLMHATEQSPAAEAAVRQLLAFAAAQCTAREVFTLCMATLAQELRQAACAWVPAVPSCMLAGTRGTESAHSVAQSLLTSLPGFPLFPAASCTARAARWLPRQPTAPPARPSRCS